MISRMHSGYAYRAYDRYVAGAEARLRKGLPSIGVHDPQTVGERLIQRVVELTLWPFVAAFANDPSRAVEDGGGRTVACDGITIDPVSRSTRIAFPRWLRSVGEFLLHWSHITTAILSGVFAARSSSDRPVTLVFGIGRESLVYKHSDARFVDFCKNGPIPGLCKAQALIVQAPLPGFRSVAPEWISYDRFPLHRLLSTRRLGFIGRLVIMAAQIRAFVAFMSAALRYPALALLARDLAYSYVVTALDRRGLIEAVIITNATYSSQPLWMRSPDRRKFLVHMVWYSQNIQPMVYRADGLVSDLPNYRHVRADRHWVWTWGFRTYLKKLGISCPIDVIGPVLWYLPEAATPPDDDAVRVILFDITPVTDARADQIGLIGNYYSAANMIRFIEESLEVCLEVQRQSGRRILLFLKHKRDYNSSHDPRFIELIGRLTAPGGGISLLPAESNMFASLGNATLAIVAPYSSPAYVADAVGTRAVFFDPTGELLPTFEKRPLISFAGGRDALLELLSAEVSYKPNILSGSRT